MPLAPSVCFLCEQSPLNGAVDTFRTFEPYVQTHLNGRKYVCTDCVKELAETISWVDGDVLPPFYSALEQATIKEAELQLRVEQLEAIHVDTLKTLLEKATKPVAVKALS